MEDYPHLPEYADSFIVHLQKKDRTKSTIKRYYYDLLDFFAWVRVIKKTDDLRVIQSLDTLTLKEYFLFLSEQREYRTATSKRVFTVIKSLFFYLHTNRKISSNPFNELEQTLKEDTQFTDDDFISDEEYKTLFQTLSSYEGLTEKQQKYRHLLIKRNEAILSLLYRYGITLQEITNIEMKHVHFTQHELTVINKKETRLIALDDETQQLLYEYKEKIPEVIRPRVYSSDRFFIAFDYQRGTYRFDYGKYEPKPLTVIAIQKMLRQEVRRSGLREGISSQHLRRTAILNLLKEGKDEEDVQLWFGLKSNLTLNRYEAYLEAAEVKQ
ncbi:site-specific integrase [Fictibacillus sp. 5RED26]|jgi:site-specific recombinase XerD|uniref:tyrosine-type recombinase/integrase n=1 Tax=unclassified Fictibacillus TaxID=2644029 RepID=UPI0018CCB8F1|nr:MULTISPECIES: site-specific integrase [unclassified Fictibacillus]MBH0155970.1 site-specific integrase [Fictibacillus sp. 5RED26]MBH0173163.1 site-specific integrase [Fictibacillus sp. 23RED33]